MRWWSMSVPLVLLMSGCAEVEDVVFGDNGFFDQVVAPTVEQSLSLQNTLKENCRLLEEETSKFPKLAEGVSQLSTVKSTMDRLDNAIKDQNKKLDDLNKYIRQIVLEKSSGGSGVSIITIWHGLKKRTKIIITIVVLSSWLWLLAWTILSLIK